MGTPHTTAETRFNPEEFRNLTPSEVRNYYLERVPWIRSSRGIQWRGPCPLHHSTNKKSVSFVINPTNGFWNCKSQCGRGGDIISLEMELTGVNFITALSQIYNILGKPVPERHQLTREEYISFRDTKLAAEKEQSDSDNFAIAAIALAEEVLSVLDSESTERALHTQLITKLHSSPVVVYREWMQRDPQYTRAIVAVGRKRQSRCASLTWKIINALSKLDPSEDSQACIDEILGEATQ